MSLTELKILPYNLDKWFNSQASLVLLINENQKQVIRFKNNLFFSFFLNKSDDISDFNIIEMTQGHALQGYLPNLGYVSNRA